MNAMTKNNSFNILESLNSIPVNSKIGLIIRHAERNKSNVLFPTGNPILTQKGAEDAYNFGRKIKSHQPFRIFTSPIDRCVQTSKEIEKGIGNSIQIRQDEMLGNHGPFVLDPKLTWQKMQELDNKFIKYWLSGKFDPKIIRFIEDGTKVFLTWLKSKLNETKNGLDIYVSHDLIITPIISTLFDYDILNEGMIGYLDGFVVYKSNENNIKIIFRGE